MQFKIKNALRRSTLYLSSKRAFDGGGYAAVDEAGKASVAGLWVVRAASSWRLQHDSPGAITFLPSAVVGRARYEALLRFYEAAGAAFQAEAVWTRMRIAACDSLAESTDASWHVQQPSMDQCVACGPPCEPMDVY